MGNQSFSSLANLLFFLLLIFSIFATEISASWCSKGKELVDEFSPYCINCEANTYGPDGLKCYPCPLNSVTSPDCGRRCGAQSISACLCLPGYFAVNAGRSNMTCLPCPKGTFSPTIGAKSQSECMSCINFAEELTSIAASSCPCLAGFYWNNTECSPCPLGTFNPSLNSTNIGVCSSCPVGTASASPGSSSCARCTANTVSPAIKATSCFDCGKLCTNSKTFVCSPEEKTTVFTANPFANTCRYNGPICLYDNVRIIPGAAYVSDIDEGDAVHFDPSQSWALSGWFHLQSKQDGQVIFSFSSNGSSFSYGNMVLVLHPQNRLAPMSLNIVTGEKSFTSLSIGSPQTVFQTKNLNWFMLTWDRVGSHSSMGITINNASYEYDLSSKNYSSFTSWTLPSNAVFESGKARFSSAFKSLFGGLATEFRLFTPGSPVLDSPIQQPIFPTAMAQAVGCPSDFPSCTLNHQYLKLPPIPSIEALPQCVCDDGYYLSDEAACLPCPGNYYCTNNQKIRCPPHLPLSYQLSKRSTECYANATFQALNPVGMPNIDIAARGYHLLYANPNSMSGPDPGLRDLVFDFNSFDGSVSFDQRYVIPFGTSVFEDVSCEIDFISSVISSSQSYKNLLETKANVKGGGLGYSFQASAEYKQVDEGSTSRGSTFTSTEAECSLYTVTVEIGKTRLSQPFLSFIEENVIELANNSTKALEAVVNRFGTHVAGFVNMGSRYGEMLEIAQEHVSQSSERELKIKANVRMSSFFSAAGSYTSNNAGQSEFEKSITNRYTFSVGSTPSSDGSATAWASRTISNPAVIAMKDLTALSELLTTNYFSGIPTKLLLAARKNLQHYIIHVCPECDTFLDDYDVCFGGMVVNSINTLTNSVGCPPHFVLSDNLISENNLWGLTTLHYCYHESRCGVRSIDGMITATRLPSVAPTSTSDDTVSVTSFGGMFSRMVYFTSNGQNDGEEIDLLAYLVNKDGVPFLECPDDSKQEDCWADWYSTYSSYKFSLPILLQGFLLGEEKLPMKLDLQMKFFRFFDEIRTKNQRAFRPSSYRMRGNALNAGKQSCAPGFKELFLGVFYGRRGVYNPDPSDRTVERVRHAHAALFICIAADLPQGADPGDTMPGSSYDCSANYHEDDNVALIHALNDTSCSFPYIYANYMRPDDPRFNAFLQGTLNEAVIPFDNLLVVTTELPGQGRGILPLDKSINGGNRILRGGEYTVVKHATLGGMFSRGTDLSINIPLDPDTSASKLYITASQNWMFNALDSCPPGYKEYVMFTTQSPGIDSPKHTEPFHDAKVSPLQGSSQVILCLLTSRTAYETATLGVKDTGALLRRTKPVVFAEKIVQTKSPPQTTSMPPLKTNQPAHTSMQSGTRNSVTSAPATMNPLKSSLDPLSATESQTSSSVTTPSPTTVYMQTNNSIASSTSAPLPISTP